MEAGHWKPPQISWVFKSPSGPGAAAVGQDLEEQLNLGFAFANALEVAVVKDTKPLKPRGQAAADEGVKGAPPGHAALEKGAPPGMALAATVPEPKAVGKAKAKASGKGRGKGFKRPAAAEVASESSPAAAAPPVSDAPVPGKRRRISVPDGVTLGCGKCKRDPVGCTTCRPKAGLVESTKGVWIFKAD